MKKQIQTNQLVFRKDGLIELNHQELKSIDGGSTPACAATVYFAWGAAGFIVGRVAGRLIFD